MKGVINIIVKKNKKNCLILFVMCIIIFTASEKDTKYVDIYNVVQEAFTTGKGYTNKLSKHISEKVGFKFDGAVNEINIGKNSMKLDMLKN